MQEKHYKLLDEYVFMKNIEQFKIIKESKSEKVLHEKNQPESM